MGGEGCRRNVKGEKKFCNCAKPRKKKKTRGRDEGDQKKSPSHKPGQEIYQGSGEQRGNRRGGRPGNKTVGRQPLLHPPGARRVVKKKKKPGITGKPGVRKKDKGKKTGTQKNEEKGVEPGTRETIRNTACGERESTRRGNKRVGTQGRTKTRDQGDNALVRKPPEMGDRRSPQTQRPDPHLLTFKKGFGGGNVRTGLNKREMG